MNIVRNAFYAVPLILICGLGMICSGIGFLADKASNILQRGYELLREEWNR